jgi:hypothetical protein
MFFQCDLNLNTNTIDKMISYCGLSCDVCPIHLATIETDENLKQILKTSIAKKCLEKYAMDLQLQDITDCDGCRAKTGRLLSGCLECEIRQCAIEKNIESCAYCNDYACEKLEKQFLLDPEAKLRLDEIRRSTN